MPEGYAAVESADVAAGTLTRDPSLIPKPTHIAYRECFPDDWELFFGALTLTGSFSIACNLTQHAWRDDKLRKLIRDEIANCLELYPETWRLWADANGFGLQPLTKRQQGNLRREAARRSHGA